MKGGRKEEGEKNTSGKKEAVEAKEGGRGTFWEVSGGGGIIVRSTQWPHYGRLRPLTPLPSLSAVRVVASPTLC